MLLEKLRDLVRLLPERFRPRRCIRLLVLQRTGRRVWSGPFAGMSYVEKSVGGQYIPKLLGIYEQELHPVIDDIEQSDIDTIINVGAAEGYYAVGLARLIENARVHSFERKPEGRELIRELARSNNVADRVSVSGKCGPAELAQHLPEGRRTLIVCDVEGQERELLDIDRVPGLRDSYVLVELHEAVHQDIAELIESRFEATHDISRIWQRERTADEFPFRSLCTRVMPRMVIQGAVSEWRPERMSWLWMRPERRGTRATSAGQAEHRDPI